MSTPANESKSSAPNGRRGGRGGASNPGQGSRGGAAGGGRRKNNTNASRAQAPREPAATANTTPATVKDDASSLVAGTALLTVGNGDGDDEAAAEDVCWLCAEPVKFYSVAECNHRTCHVCAVRLRALYKKMDCAFCKAPQIKVIFTESPSRLWEEYTPDMLPFEDDKLKISFETDDMMQETLFLLRFNCPDNDCTFTGTGWADLKWHTRDMHGLLLCDLCIRHKKIFAHEHTLYNPKQLLLHVPSMKRIPTMPPQHQHRSKDPDKDKGKGVEGKEVVEVDSVHPLCSFCRECFYSDDELYAHLRERHEECFVCKRMGTRDVYFQNYEKLDQHFQAEHFPCKHGNCLEQKFVVFPSAIDLQAHQIETHGQTMGARERKDKMRVDVGFSFEETRPGGRHGGGGGGGRSGAGPSNSASSAPTQNTGGGRRIVFGSSLTPAASAQDNNAPNDDHADVVHQTADLAPLQDHLRNLSTSAQFQVISSVRSFRASECSAREMIDTVFSVFDRNLDVMGSVVTKILDVFEGNEEKKTELLAAWNGIKVQERQQFPSLAPVASSSQAQAGWAGIASGRVINIKKATSQRSGKNHQSRNIWDRIEQAATSSSTPAPFTSRNLNRNGQPRAAPAPSSSAFPSLSASVPGSAPSVRAAAQRATPWTTSGQQMLSPAPPTPAPAPPIQPYSVSAPASSNRSPGAPPTTSMQLFPTLRASSAARVPPPKEFLGGNRSARNIQQPGPASAWGGSSSSQPVTLLSADSGGGNGGGKKKKKGKETLFTLGAYPNA